MQDRFQIPFRPLKGDPLLQLASFAGLLLETSCPDSLIVTEGDPLDEPDGWPRQMKPVYSSDFVAG